MILNQATPSRADVFEKVETTGESPRDAPARACQRGPKVSVFATILDCVTDSVEPTPVSYTPSEASNLAIAAAGLAGFSVSDSVRNMLARLDSGEITEEQAIAEIKARYTEPLA